MKIVGRILVDRLLSRIRNGAVVDESEKADLLRRLRELGPMAVSPLFDAVRRPESRPFALEALRKLLDDTTLPGYLQALAAPDLATSGAATEILRDGRTFGTTPILDRLADAGIPPARIESILAAQFDRVDPGALVERLTALDKDRRAAVFRLLENHADPRTLQLLLPLAQDGDWTIRLQVARLLGRITGEPAIGVALRLLRDGNRTIRLEATRALGRLAAPTAIPHLCTALRDNDLRVQTAAIDALVAIGNPAAVPHLVDLLKDESEQARRGAVEVLNEVVTVDAVKDLVHALRDEDWWVRARAADALGTLGGPKVVEAVIELVADADEFVRRYAVEILNTVSDERAVEPLVRALHDDDWWVRERAIDALGRLGDSRAVPPLLALIDEDAKAAPLGVKALGEIGDPRALPAFGRLIRSESHELRGRTIEALRALLKRDLTQDQRDEATRCLRDAGAKAGDRPTPVRPRTSEPAAVTPPADASPPEAAPVPVRLNYQALEIGTVLAGRYRIMRRIGGGGFGSVYLTEDLLLREESILKILSPQLSLDENMIRRFVQELRLTRRITHPAVIRIHEILDLGDTRAISMEYFPGRDLARILKSEGSLPPARVVPIALQVCEALAAAHELGIIHRDVKPGNILIGPNDTVRVVDFGLAAVGMQLGSRLTKSGLLLGTPEYMSPEQISTGSSDARSDLYSLGTVLYEALSGNCPFSGENTMNVLFQHVEGTITPLDEVVPALPAGLADAVMAALARDPADRPASAAELRRRLLQVPLATTPREDAA